MSAEFDDVYFSRDNGLAESRHVFIEGNQLPHRWQNLQPGQTFTIMETGFGTGLNFLAACKLWLALAPTHSQLHFVSAEKFPLSRHDLAKALEPWTELKNLSQPLIENYPPAVAGFHRLWLYDNRVCLTLLFDDAAHSYEQLCGSNHPDFFNADNPCADAWFLDGFAPSKNPDMWSAQLFKAISRLSHHNTSVATFTVARVVRDGLTSAGFDLSKQPGFGRKRDMLTARKSVNYLPDADIKTQQETPWYLNLARASSSERRVAVIGGGIAGCATAKALSARGWQVSLFDPNPHLGAEASGNPQGILYPKLSLEDLALSLYGRAALCHAQHYYHQAWRRGDLGVQTGVLVLPETAREQEQFEQIAQRYSDANNLVQYLSGNQLGDTAGIHLDNRCGLYFPQLGWIRPRAICEWLGEGIEHIQQRVCRLEHRQNDGKWLLLDEQDRPLFASPQVVICTGYNARLFSQLQQLPLRRIRGQISVLKETAASRHLKTVICGHGYVAPSLDGFHTLGATYGVDDDNIDVRMSDHAQNLDTLQRTDALLPALFAPATDPQLMTGRAAIRCTTPDYLPLAGPAPDLGNFIDTYSDLRRNAKRLISASGPFWPGLWLNCGHGSRGFSYAPLAAELVASQIDQQPLPLPRHLVTAVNPARFIIRDLKRNRV